MDAFVYWIPHRRWTLYAYAVGRLDWTPDSGSIVFWSGGGIHRIDIETEEVTPIPFEVNDTREVIDPVRPAVAVAPDTFETRMPRFTSVSPDGSQVVFENLGKLYIMDTDGGEPRRLTRDRRAAGQ